MEYISIFERPGYFPGVRFAVGAETELVWAAAGFPFAVLGLPLTGAMKR